MAEVVSYLVNHTATVVLYPSLTCATTQGEWVVGGGDGECGWVGVRGEWVVGGGDGECGWEG